MRASVTKVQACLKNNITKSINIVLTKGLELGSQCYVSGKLLSDGIYKTYQNKKTLSFKYNLKECMNSKNFLLCLFSKIFGVKTRYDYNPNTRPTFFEFEVKNGILTMVHMRK